MAKTYDIPLSSPLFIMAKSAGATCNLNCDYCYYLEKKNLYPKANCHLMSEALLKKFIWEYIESQLSPRVLFTLHGGELLTHPLSFYQRAVVLQQ